MQRSALILYNAKEDELKVPILKSLGEGLLTKDNKAKAALSIFLAANDVDGAKRAARAAGDWRQLFTLQQDEEGDEEAIKLRISQLAHEVADDIVSRYTSGTKRNSLADAGRILLDYGNDIVASIEKYCEAEMWTEARRIALQHNRVDLVKRVIESAVNYAHAAIGDFVERNLTFDTTTKRYVEVLKIRKQAHKEMEESGLDSAQQRAEDESGSMFSLASNASLRSTASTGSVSSTVSSVISISNQSTFSMTSESDRLRHKSKYNQVGRDNKKKKKKKKTRAERGRRIVPGSEADLNRLAETLKITVVGNEYAGIIGEACMFLSQVGHLDLGKEMYAAYMKTKTDIEDLQQNRIIEAEKEAAEAEKESRRAGTPIGSSSMKLPCEAVVNELRCSDLQSVVHDLFTAF